MLKRLVDRFAAVPLVGIDVGSSLIKAVEVSFTDGRWLLGRCAMEKVEGNDPHGALTRLFSKAKLTRTRVAVGISSPEVIVRPFQFPRMAKKEMASAIKLEAEQAVLNGHSLSGVAVDYHLFPSGSRDSIRGLLAVVPKTMLAQRLDLLQKAGFQAAIVDVEGLALWNGYWVLFGFREPAGKTVMLIHIGTRITNVVIAKHPDRLILLRDIQLGGSSLTESHGAEWASELRDSMSYARSKEGLRTLDAVYVSGGGSTQELIPLLKRTVNSPITSWNPLTFLAQEQNASRVEDSLGSLLAIAIGLALRQPR